MNMRFLSAALCAACVAPVSAQDRPVPSDAAVFEQIRREGSDRSQVRATFDHLVTVIGPRLSGTPEYKAAADWSRDTLTKWGLSGARLEPFEFGRGWVLDRQVLEMIDPRYMPLYAAYRLCRGVVGIDQRGTRRNVLPGIGSTDHLSFKPVNVPAFNPVQDYVDDDVRTTPTLIPTSASSSRT